MPRQDRKQREFERREADILDAALALLSQPGWETVTIARIAEAADVGKGTVYKHFASKDELLFRLMLRFYRGLLDTLRPIEPRDGDILGWFRETFLAVFRYHLERREYRYVVEYCKRIDFKERADESWHATFGELDRAFSEWGDPRLLEAMDKGLIERRPLQDIQVGMHACLDGAVNLLWSGRDWCVVGDSEQIIESATAFMIAGMVGNLAPG